jgi:hypothetical protein
LNNNFNSNTYKHQNTHSTRINTSEQINKHYEGKNKEMFKLMTDSTYDYNNEDEVNLSFIQRKTLTRKTHKNHNHSKNHTKETEEMLQRRTLARDFYFERAYF